MFVVPPVTLVVAKPVERDRNCIIDCVAQRNAVHEQTDFIFLSGQVPNLTNKHTIKPLLQGFLGSLISNPRSNLTSEAYEAVLKRNFFKYCEKYDCVRPHSSVGKALNCRMSGPGSNPGYVI